LTSTEIKQQGGKEGKAANLPTLEGRLAKGVHRNLIKGEGKTLIGKKILSIVLGKLRKRSSSYPAIISSLQSKKDIPVLFRRKRKKKNRGFLSLFTGAEERSENRKTKSPPNGKGRHQRQRGGSSETITNIKLNRKDLRNKGGRGRWGELEREEQVGRRERGVRGWGGGEEIAEGVGGGWERSVIWSRGDAGGMWGVG